MREAEYAIFADKHNWKYAWFGEHHALTEYSHMSAPEVVMGYIAAQTDYIHLSTGINSLSPRKEHPVRYAERAAMLDHFTNNRFEWGTGRGAGSHEMATFNIMDTRLDQGRVGRGGPGDPADVGAGRLHVRRRALHRADAPQRAPQALRQGSPADLGGVRQPAHVRKAGELGIGAIAFNFEPIFNLQGRIDAYKEGVANCTEPDRPVQERQRDDHELGDLLRDREEARKIALRNGRGYLVTMVNLYHDTMPKSQDAITWPSAPLSLRDLSAGDEDALLDELIEGGYMLCGTPDEVSEQISRWGDVGMDQLVFGLPVEGLHHDEILECLELFGDKVIPEFDTDRTHSTDRYRATAQPKYAKFNQPLPEASSGRRSSPRARSSSSRADDALVRPCPATAPPPRNGCSAKPSGCSRGAGSTRSPCARSPKRPGSATSRP